MSAFVIALKDAAVGIRGRPFVGFSAMDFVGETITIEFEQGGPQRFQTYTNAQVVAWLGANLPDVLALLDDPTPTGLAEHLRDQVRYWVKPDGTPPPEFGWPDSDVWPQP